MSQGFVNSGFNAKCAGDVVQVQRYETGAVATGTTTTPFDDTIPQNTEGTELMTVSITPTNVNSTLKIDIVANVSHSDNAGSITVALHQDSTANALAVSGHIADGTLSERINPVILTHYMAAGTTSSTTFKVRAGSNKAGTLTFNGSGGGRIYGGVMASSITVTEIASGTLIRETGYNIAGNTAVAKAWCVFNGTTAGTNAPTLGYNVTSVQRVSSGVYIINLTTPFSSSNYAVSGMTNNAHYITMTTASASAPGITTNDHDGSVSECNYVSLVFFGNQ